MSVGLQNIVVTVAALAAAGVFLRRFLSGRGADTPSCPSCDNGQPCAPAGDRPAEPEVKPLVLIKKAPRT